MRSRSTALVVGAGAVALALSACSGGTGAGNSGGGSTSGKVTSIKLVAAEYSKDHTKAFWNDFATEVQGRRRATRSRCRSSAGTTSTSRAQHDDPEQQPAGHPQPQRLRELRQGRPALQLRRGAARRGEVRPARRVRQVRHVQGQVLRHARPVLGPRAVLQQGPVQQGRHRRAAEDVGRVRGRTPRRSPPSATATSATRLPLGPEESQGEFSIWLFNNGGDWKTDGKWTINSPKNVETLTFLKKLAVDDKVTQNNPGKTNRAATPSTCSSSGKAGMVVGFSPLAGRRSTRTRRSTTASRRCPTKRRQRRRRPSASPTTSWPSRRRGNQDAVKAFYDLYYQPDQVNTFIKAEGFLPVTKSGIQQFSSRRRSSRSTSTRCRTRT